MYGHRIRSVNEQEFWLAVFWKVRFYQKLVNFVKDFFKVVTKSCQFVAGVFISIAKKLFVAY